jgi:hypothetical protein
MTSDLFIVDNFYTNAYNTIQYAWGMEWFDQYGNHPGIRTKEEQDPSVFNAMSHLMSGFGGKITKWEDMLYNGCFNLCLETDKTWIHADAYNDWAGVCYLTPNAPINAGTGIFKHKETGLIRVPKDENGNIDQEILDLVYQDANDWDKWEMVDYVANVFNRLVVYRGDLFHSAVNYFGTGFEDGRMHQTFFFNTEY